MDVWNAAIENWYFIIYAILLCILFYKLSKPNGTFAGMQMDTAKLVFHLLVIIFVCMIINKVLFHEHHYFFIAMVVFVPILAAFIKWLLSRDDVYIFQSTMQGETFLDIKNVKKIIADNTSHRLLIMPREIYDSKIHIGDLHYSFWTGSPRIKFCDYYDDETGTFFHPPLSQLHNYTFYAIKSFWIKLKTDLPHIIDRNTELTLLSDWYLAYKMDAIRNNMDVFLKSLNEQHIATPFKMPETMDELFERAVRDKMRDVAESEKRKSESSDNPKSETKPEPTVTGGGDG